MNVRNRKMGISKFCLGASVMLSGGTTLVSADIIAMPSNSANGSQGFGNLAGTDFNTSQTITVTQLGVFDNGADGTLHTNAGQPVVVQLWNRNTGIALATLKFGDTFPTGTDTTTGSGKVFFQSLSTPLTLTPGNYYVSADFDGPEQFIDASGGTFTTPNTGGGAVSYVAGGRFSQVHGQMYTASASAPFTTNGGINGPAGHTGPEYSLANFQFNVATSVATPIAGLTGWNKTVVHASNSPSLGGGFDGQGHGLIVNGVAGAIAGLPALGAITMTTSGDQFQLQPYTGNDSAQWTGGTTNNGVSNHSVTISLTAPGSYSALSFLASSGSGGNSTYTGDVTLNFVGGSSTTYSAQLNEPDWTSTVANSAIDAPVGNMNFDNGGSAANFIGVGLTETTLSLSPSDQSLQLQSITFSGGTLSSGQGAIDNVLAISGVAAVPEPASLGLLGLGATMLIGRRRRI